MQGQLWVSGYAWCDFMSYFPELPPVLIRVLPDDRYQDALDQHMPTFLDEMFDGRRRLQAYGHQSRCRHYGWRSSAGCAGRGIGIRCW